MQPGFDGIHEAMHKQIAHEIEDALSQQQAHEAHSPADHLGSLDHHSALDPHAAYRKSSCIEQV